MVSDYESRSGLNGKRMRGPTAATLVSLFALSMLLGGTAWAQGTTVDLAQRFALVGVVLGRSDGPVAAITDRRTGRDALYHVGAQIQDMTLLVVAADRVVFRAGGQDIELRLATSPRGSDIPTAAAPPRRPIRGRAAPRRRLRSKR